ncbi:MAG: beta-galactosidase trimerization domain-containing protein [Kiritimatiellaeota bacterium]|nr:beta-galactosidase trimerization domain-containing protein [Kiritimatiellota bacterium]
MKRVFSHLVLMLLAALLAPFAASASEVFIEAESFTSAGGWSVVTGAAARSASGLALLGGASGSVAGVATAKVNIKDAGHYRLWVRYASGPAHRGPFHVTALAGERVLDDGLFDASFEGKSERDAMTWRAFEAELPEGEVTLRLSKHEQKNCSGYARQVDCLLLTMDDNLVPNHLHYGAQTFVRVTLGAGYEKPAYIHIFADHFRAPWYQHYSLARAGAVAAVAPKKADLLQSGERTPWCNITPLIYQDSGAMLFISARHAYTEHAERLRATFEFATTPDEKSIVRTLKLDNQPAGVVIFLPPNLLAPENRALLKTDREIAEENGRLADACAWPAFGKRPERFPFFVTSGSLAACDEAVRAREQKTLDYFGYTQGHLRHIGGAWFMKEGSYCQPDIEKMQARLATAAADFKKAGGRVQDIAFCELTDEPTGQPLEFAAKDAAYTKLFRAWLQAQGQTPADLLVQDWEAVKIVTSEQRDEFPALYYFSQRFRTRALGDFMATQRKLAEAAFGGTFPVLANFSDGAIYTGNFYAQGVDYFELLDAPEQNAIWGEDWANGASSYQCAAFNVELMRAAARERGQVIGHHLVAHAGRKAWDIQLKAASELARGVKVMNNFCYGPTWATHEGGPYWRSHVWPGKPETWIANASVTREVGAVEDMLLTAMPAPAKVALLYSSASDVWTLNGNLAYGFDRMHTWLALAHAQVPVDVVSEQQAAKNALDDYAVCYLTGPNLTRAAAAQLKQWVQRGGTLWLAAGAATRDEFNRPLHTLDDLLPAERSAAVELQKFTSSGRYLRTLVTKDTVQWAATSADVLAVKQALTPRAGATVLARFKDQSAAVVCGAAGKGRVYCVGFLPGLAYIKQALDARHALEEKTKTAATTVSADDAALLARSYNPWAYPTALRDCLLTPVREAGVNVPIQCSAPLVDAVYMTHEQGVLVPLANYSNRPIASLALKVTVPRRIAKVESARLGLLAFRQPTPQVVELSLPLENNDFVKLYFK